MHRFEHLLILLVIVPFFVVLVILLLLGRTHRKLDLILIHHDAAVNVRGRKAKRNVGLVSLVGQMDLSKFEVRMRRTILVYRYRGHWLESVHSIQSLMLSGRLSNR